MLELDYRREAQNMVTIGKNLAPFTRIRIPQPIDDLSSARVLTMDYIAGCKITKASPLVLADAHARELADELFRAYLYQVIVDGVFHADPHPGNVLLTDEGQIALLDLGMVSVLPPELQDRLLHFLLAVAETQTDRAADLALQLGERLEGYDEPTFRRRVAQVIVDHQGATVGEIHPGRLMLEVARSSADAGVRLPNELTLLGKTLLNLDEIGRTLAPDFELQASLRRHANELITERMRRSVNSATAFSTLLEAKTFAERLPARVDRVLDSLANQELKLRVELIDEGSLIDGLQKVANRITLGLLIAAAILGAAMLMRVDTSFRIFGYPGLAMLFFLAAAFGAAWLAVTIARHDA
jgi:ubiquinone biosynthesis protein